MFSGIVETTGVVVDIVKEGSNNKISIKSSISSEAYIDQSISHDGVCLTVVDIQEDTHSVIAIYETLQKSNLNHWKKGDLINLERSVRLSDRMDGHMVQGHVDTTVQCSSIQEKDGSWFFKFLLPAEYRNMVVSKGSICINGVSLTIAEITENDFTVAIIPYTHQHTNFKDIKESSIVNVEFDIIGKYIVNYLNALNMMPHEKIISS